VGRHYFPIEFSADTAADELGYFQFKLGAKEQTVEVGGVTVLDFGTNASVDELPSGVAGQIYGPYYQQLVDDVTGRGFPTPEFAHANTEAGTRNAYFFQNNVGETSETDLGGDDVRHHVGTGERERRTGAA